MVLVVAVLMTGVMQGKYEPAALVMEEEHFQGRMLKFSRRKEPVLEGRMGRKHHCIEVSTLPEG